MTGLARSMGLPESEYNAFRAAVKSLMKSGRVVRGVGSAVMLPDATNTIVGTFRGNPRGFGFVVPESPANHGDLFIPPPATLTAITGDTVVARITRRRKRGDSSLVEGEIIEILKRGQNRFVGELVRQAGQWLMLPDGHSLDTPVILSDVTATRAQSGDQVVTELTQFPAPYSPARGVIVEVLGRRHDPEIDTLSIIRQYHLHEEFPEEVLQDARQAIRKYNLDTELQQRDDLRDLIVVTIDPQDARDFDDAISIRRLSKDQVELGIHIADVASFVRPGSPLDQEARLRGNSIYFPRHVIPMLPEVLSNGLCSLQENEPRLAKSVFVTYDNRGRRIAKRYANTVIQSNRRLTYEQATTILEGKTRGFKTDVVDLVRAMNDLARSIQKRRLRAGMIVLDLPDVELVLGEHDEVIDIVPEDTSFSHTIIEMFMVEANEAVSELLTELHIPHLRRIHPAPPATAKTKLTQFLRVLGKPIPARLERADMLRILAAVKGQPASFAVNLAVLRSMSPAEYSPKTIGHFALASRHYAHFTSPIRRYPDLTVHRLLQRHLTGELDSRGSRVSVPSASELTEIGNHCSYTEQHAEAAERELKLIKTLRFLAERLGEDVTGIVSGVTNIGVFVQLPRYRIDGLIRFADLPDDWWDINSRAGCAIGQHTGRRIAIGDEILTRIAAVDLAARELDLALVAEQEKRKPIAPKTETKTHPARKTGHRTASAGKNRPKTRPKRSRHTRRRR